jgi:uncharacterized protein (TIRG00374 family)
MKTRFVLTALLAFALLFWLLRGVNLAEVWTHVQSADRWSMIGGLIFVAITYVTRAIRWQYLLAPIGKTRLRTAFRATVIGFAALTLLPFRMGDLLRPYLLAKQERLSVSAALATVAMERILDLMAVLVMLGIFLWVGSDATQLSPRAAAALDEVKFWGAIFAIVSVVAVVVMWALATHPNRAAALVLTVEHLTSPKIAHALAQFVSYFSSGFGAMRSPVTLAWSVFWSFAVWLAIAGETWIVSRGFGIDMSFVGSFVMQPLLVLGVASGTPGGLGPYQWAYVLGVTTFFGASEESGVAASFVVWVISFVPVVVFGLIYMAQDGLSLGRLNQLASEARGKEPSSSDEMSILRSSRR